MKTPQEIVDSLTPEQDSQLYNDVWYDSDRREGWEIVDEAGDVQWAIDLGLVVTDSRFLTWLGLQVASIVRGENLLN